MKGKLKNEKNENKNFKRVPVILHDNFVHGGNERDGTGSREKCNFY